MPDSSCAGSCTFRIASPAGWSASRSTWSCRSCPGSSKPTSTARSCDRFSTWRWKRLYFALNPIVDFDLGGAQPGRPQIQPALKLTVSVASAVALGIEYYLAFGPVRPRRCRPRAAGAPAVRRARRIPPREQAHRFRSQRRHRLQPGRRRRPLGGESHLRPRSLVIDAEAQTDIGAIAMVQQRESRCSRNRSRRSWPRPTAAASTTAGSTTA